MIFRCTVCRTLKTRCLPSNDGQDDLAPCARCQRLELECDYTTKRRGRPITIGRRLANLAPPRSVMTPSNTENQKGAVPSVQHTEGVQETGYMPSFGIETLPPVSVGPPPLPIGLADLQSPGILPTYGDSSHVGWASRPINTPSPFIVPDHQYEGMRGIVNPHRSDICAKVASLEPYLGSEDSRSPTPELSRDDVKPQNPQAGVFSDSGSAGMSAMPDMSNPVELGLLSEAEAMFLFQQFMDRMAPFAYMFDDAYHNYQFVRRSAVLLSATTAVMARFLRPDLFDLLREHTELLISRQFRSGALDLQAIQASLVLAFWKTPKDESAPLKMGLAVRAACLLHLKDHVLEPNTLDSLATREKLDRERTWSALLRMDTVCCLFNRLPASLAVFDDNEIYPFARWSEDHGHFGIAADSMIAFAFGLIGILKETCLSLVWPRPPERPIDVSKFDMKTLNATIQQHLNRWLATSALTGPYRSLAKIAANRFSGQLEAEQLRVRPSTSGAEALVQAMSAGCGAIRELAISGHLRFVSEHLATTILMPGLTFFHV
ncbi:hypothetical protein BCR39DRAFT_285759 [Naematelia encephala]|uniref:Zn(2)-C6 fungal-type domain-containing protein n=1 Tax=Naematelia encephala TaxID=71784 RepID=A0A1Y2ASS5_9TREE|nr:hypothetical protein BCR39DRAFT_285759 [Naematelia encephala]